MALNITSPVTTLDGITLPTSYARIEVRDGVSGTQLITGIQFYVNAQAFESGKGALLLATPGLENAPIQTYWVSDYNRVTDGSDLLLLGHEVAQGALSNMGISSTIDL